MKKVICILLAISLMLSIATPVFAEESEEIQYGTIKVEYSDALRSVERLDVMVKDDHVYADAVALSDRLGYDCIQDGDLVSIYTDNNFFYPNAPLLAVHFYMNENKVAYNPLFGAEYEYTAPASCIVDENGIWVPLTYTLVLLGGNSTMLDDTLLIQMPQNNVLSIAAAIVNNEDTLSFDWVSHFGYSEITTNVTDGAGRIVTLFSGLLEFDGDAWLSLIDWSAFDKKFGKSLATMFCTNSSEELQESIEQVELLLDVFSPEGKAGEMLRNKQIRIDSDVTAWKNACDEYLELLEQGSGSPTKYNMLYQQYERAVDDQSLFAALGGDNAIYIQNELSSAANVLDIASKVGSAVSYFQEFQQKDIYQISVLKNYLSTRTPTDDMPDATADAMMKYIASTNSAGQYIFSKFLEENALELIVDKSGLDAYLGLPANILLFAWDIMSGTIPFYSEGLKAVENREISNYAQKVQNDALENLKYLIAQLKKSSTISAADCVQLSEYCYVYLKACYIARSSAIKSLDNTSEEFREQIKGKLEVEADINQFTIQYLATLSNADIENSCYILGFLPENSEEYLDEYSDEALLPVIMIEEENPEINPYNDILTMYHTSISCSWTNCDGNGWENVGDPDNACYILWHYEKERSLSEVGYCLLDINNDGQSELIISLLDVPGSDVFPDLYAGTFYDMYTIVDGEIIHVVSAGERDHYNLAEDYSINNSGSSGAAYSSNINYRLDSSNGTLKVNQAVIYDGWRDSENPYFYATTDYYNDETYEINYDVLKHLSNDEASALLESFPDNIPLELTSFADYIFALKSGDTKDFGTVIENVQTRINYNSYSTSQKEYCRGNFFEIDGCNALVLMYYVLNDSDLTPGYYAGLWIENSDGTISCLTNQLIEEVGDPDDAYATVNIRKIDGKMYLNSSVRQQYNQTDIWENQYYFIGDELVLEYNLYSEGNNYYLNQVQSDQSTFYSTQDKLNSRTYILGLDPNWSEGLPPQGHTFEELLEQLPEGTTTNDSGANNSLSTELGLSAATAQAIVDIYTPFCQMLSDTYTSSDGSIAKQRAFLIVEFETDNPNLVVHYWVPNAYSPGQFCEAWIIYGIENGEVAELYRDENYAPTRREIEMVYDDSYGFALREEQTGGYYEVIIHYPANVSDITLYEKYNYIQLPENSHVLRVWLVSGDYVDISM